MKIATLLSNRTVHARIARALVEQGIEVVSFTTLGALVAAQAVQAFAAILVEDSTQRISERLATLQPHLAAQTALIVVGAGGAASISRALLHGADDYANSCELASEHLVQRAIARASVKLRASQKSTLKLGACTLDLARGTLHSQGLHVRLTSREATLARLLFERCNEVVTTGQLCQALCGRIDAGAERAVKQHAYVLRRKLQQVAASHAEPLRIETVYGKGYQLVW
jgi:DNA-binding response OmpR family regulator